VPTSGISGLRVIVSGGTSGLGHATAEYLSNLGARVWILGSSESTLTAALKGLDVAGGGWADAADEPAVIAAVAEAVESLGGLDGAFVNAGMDGEDKHAQELSADHFRRVLDVNVVGAFVLAREAAKAMEEGGGAIVINASVNGERAEKGFADYNASKAAAISLAQSLALDLSDRRVAVTAICPGYVRTRMTESYLNDPAVAEELVADIPAGRFGEPEEIARLVAFLLDPGSSYMTGSVVAIAGGRNV
jgi:NAD(P)-dependent dehydrogenase (short-subunit alcohol dehydrogenase family)